MKAKKGISLIVLVITIIVIIILAGAVILSLQKNNLIDQATQAKYVSDKDSIQSEVTLALSSIMAKNQQAGDIDMTGATTTPDGKTALALTSSAVTVNLTNGKTDTFEINDLPTDGQWFVDADGKVYLYVTTDTKNNTVVEVSNWDTTSGTTTNTTNP